MGLESDRPSSPRSSNQPRKRTRSPANLLPARESEPLHSGFRSKATSLGWGDGGLEGDMGRSQDGPMGPSQQANPQDSPPVAPRYPARATNPLRRVRPMW